MNPKKLVAAHLTAHHFTARSLLLPTTLAVLFVAAPATAFQPGIAPVSIKVVPEVALVKSKVTLSGTSLIVGKNNEVIISVASASGESKPAPKTIKATLDDKGNFKTDFSVETEGKFQITATAPDGKGTASTTLQVAAPLAAAGRPGWARDLLFP